MPKAIILGLDGATFDLLLPRVERGEMPHLARLLAEGAWGGLRSTTPPFSAQAWVSLATGKNQAKHGVVDFWVASPEVPLRRRNFVSTRQIRAETLWQMAGRQGLQVGVINVPVTHPPQPVNGYLVTGFLTPQGAEQYTYPAAMQSEIEAMVPGYNPDPFDPLGASRKQILELADWMDRHERIARHLAENKPVDLFFSVIQALDHLQHLFWNEIAAGPDAGAFAEPLARCYRLADEIIGHRRDMVDAQTNLFLVSDHGFGPARKWFHVNRFLQERGLLILGGAGGGGRLARLGLTPQRMRRAVRRVDVLGLRRRMGRLARVTLGRKLDESLTPPVDWSRTQAVSGSPAVEGILINRAVVSTGAGYEALRDRLIAELLALRDPETGETVVQAAYRREELYEGPYLDLLPDVVFDLGEGPYLAGDALLAGQVLEPLPPDYLQGKHRPTGIFVAVGPSIRPGARVEGARIVDVAPTVLYALDLPIPEDMDGRPLLEIFDDEFRSAHPVRTAAPTEMDAPEPVEGDYDADDAAEMERRLRGLGYVS